MPRPPRPDECLFCGHQPALPITLRRNLGLLITHRVSTLGGSFCRDCGTALFRSTQNRTLIGGWWGLISFFSNFLAIFINFVAWAQLRGLGPPSPPTEPLDVPSPMPMDPGRSVYRRFGFWMVAAIVAFFLLSPGGQASSSSSGSSDVSSSPSATASPPSSAPAAPSYDNSWAVGKCISADATTKLVTGVADCSGPHDATILAIVTSATDCPAATTADFTENPSDPQPGQVVCLDEGQ
jgi:hypothetical protein